MTLFGSFTYTQEVFLTLANSNLRILEVPKKVRPRKSESRKWSRNPFHYGFKAIKIILLAERTIIRSGLWDHKRRFFLLGICPPVVFINWLVVGMTSPIPP